MTNSGGESSGRSEGGTGGVLIGHLAPGQSVRVGFNMTGVRPGRLRFVVEYGDEAGRRYQQVEECYWDGERAHALTWWQRLIPWYRPKGAKAGASTCR